MIKITNMRVRGNEPAFDPLIDERGLERSFRYLVEAELGWGGKVTELTETRIVTVTYVLDCVDTTIFEGCAEEMLPLVKVAALHVAAHGTDQFLHALAAKAADTAVRVSPGAPDTVSPSFLAMAGGLIQGSLSTAAILRTVFDLNELPELTLSETTSAVLMSFDNPKADVLACYGVEPACSTTAHTG